MKIDLFDESVLLLINARKILIRLYQGEAGRRWALPTLIVRCPNLNSTTPLPCSTVPLFGSPIVA